MKKGLVTTTTDQAVSIEDFDRLFHGRVSALGLVGRLVGVVNA